MNVKVTLGKTLNAFQEKDNANVTKISRLEGIVFEKEKEIAELKRLHALITQRSNLSTQIRDAQQEKIDCVERFEKIHTVNPQCQALHLIC